MNLLLLADGHVGFDITRWLNSHYREDLSLIVSLSKNDIYKEATAAGIPCIIFSSAEDVKQYCQHLKITPDLGFLTWWPKLVKDPLLGLPKHGFINTHPSLLPYNRGKHYNFWALVEQAPFGVTLHFVDEGIDTGDIIVQQSIPYDWEDNGASLYNKAIVATIELFKSSYPKIRQLNIQVHKQREGKGSLHISKELDPDSHIDLNKKYLAGDLLNLLRARTFPGHPSCWFEDDGEAFEVRVDIKRKV